MKVARDGFGCNWGGLKAFQMFSEKVRSAARVKTTARSTDNTEERVGTLYLPRPDDSHVMTWMRNERVPRQRIVKEEHMKIRFGIGLLILMGVFLWGCSSLRKSPPMIPNREYDKLLVGRVDANYVGTTTCLAACHVHDKKRDDFNASTMGAQLSASSGMALVDCESCHGPGSLAIEGITPERVADDARAGVVTACNYETLLDLKTMPPAAKTMICTKCHTSNATFNLHDWNAGTHAGYDVTCSNCHDIHAGPDLKVKPRDTAEMCLSCHKEQRAQFMMPNRHPLLEERVFCTDCHNPHGTLADKQLRETTVKETCTRCHAEKEGPFTFEHAENTEDCTRCHVPHGSPNDHMLVVGLPFLCMQCHEGHRITGNGTEATYRQSFVRCTNCHSQIHGSDTPGVNTPGTFTH